MLVNLVHINLYYCVNSKFVLILSLMCGVVFKITMKSK